ncbi:DUF2946 family protein [Piscinibacter gummiphilus]|uniref:DUF2946 family protein n=1 Tax=Piscinibacter gummiphilus TaxID=946333 RepID=A0ABZ0CTA5_9BURK|nr:DUF2946 family protein [Piscinibacter gummiphilus]WOB08209.1 DUF2946 family protein [Piscinibacter gummiphilus]
MDEIVKAALKKWPNVPACYGWLALDARGDWYMRDDRIQAAGPFPTVKGSRINHDKLREFIERNYDRDEHGDWYFQNGPQRVYVELESAPWIWRLEARAGAAPAIRSHTGREARFEAALVDETGRLYLATDLGLGIVHTLDMETAADAIEAGHWHTEECAAADLPRRYGHRLSPQRERGAAAAHMP